jgi:hypothetical protein
MIERYPIFKDEDILRLTERDQEPHLMHAISAGCILTVVHRNGLLHGDLYGNNILFNWHTGIAALIDFDEGDYAELSPEKMAADFLVPRVSMGSDFCRALLAGYIKLGRLSIDPIYPGYCDDLLDLLGGTVESDPHLRTETLPSETLNHALAWLGERLVPAGSSDEFWLAAATPAQYAFMIGGLIAAGVDCSTLSSPPATGIRVPSIEAIRCLVESAIDGQAAPMSCPPDVPQVGWDFINLSLNAQAAGEPRAKDSRVKPDTRIFNAIKTLRNTYPQRELEEMLCAFTDVCDWLAGRADRGVGHVGRGLSIQLAQMTYMILQLVLEPDLVESAELTAARRHGLLSWYPALFDAGQKADDDFFYLFAYANTRISTYLQMFEGGESAAGYGRPWTADWRAMYMSRTWLRKLLSNRVTEEMLHDSTEFLDQLISIAARRLGATLNGHGRLTLLSLAFATLGSEDWEERSGFKGLRDEIDTVVELLKVAAKPDRSAPPAMPEYITLAKRYLDDYSQLSGVPFDKEIAR